MDKELLLNPEKRDIPALQTKEVEIKGLGFVVVRSLTRAEGFKANRPDKRGRKATPEIVEYRMVQMAMVDPELTYAEVEQWASISVASEIQKVVKAVSELSGWGDEEEEEDPVKTAYKSPDE
jgi:hypothetical protein